MKIKNIILGLLIALPVKAAVIENNFGSLTYHWVDNGIAHKYNNKISSDGKLIFTGLIGLGLREERSIYRVFMGQNSIGEFMLGGTYSYVWDLRLVNAGPVIGAYLQNDDKFRQQGIEPFSFGGGIVPIIGGEVNFKLFSFDNRKNVNLHLIITPVIVNQTISLSMEL